MSCKWLRTDKDNARTCPDLSAMQRWCGNGRTRTSPLGGVQLSGPPMRWVVLQSVWHAELVSCIAHIKNGPFGGADKFGTKYTIR